MDALKSEEQKKHSIKNVVYSHAPGFINLSVLVDEVITEFISQRPELKATFEVENNIIVHGDYSALRELIEKVIQSSVNFNSSSRHHSIVFGRVKNDLSTYYFKNSELGAQNTDASFGVFNHLDKKELGPEVIEIQNILMHHSGIFWAIGKKEVGSVFYFSIGQMSHNP